MSTQGAPENIDDVLDRLSMLEPGPEDAARPAGAALSRLRHRLPARRQTVWNRLAGHRPAFALAGILIIAFAVLFPPVRAAASDFLGLFRVQKFAPVSVSPQQLALLQEIAEQGALPGRQELSREPAAPRLIMSLDDAAGIYEAPVRILAGRDPAERLYLVEGSSGLFTIDLDGARAILEAAGLDPGQLPDSLDGAEIRLNTAAGISQNWSDGLSFIQMPTPEVSYPNDIDITILGESLLQILGMAPDEAARLSRSIDWTGTLLLPIPTQLATYEEVRIDGVSGLALRAVDQKSSALVWQSDGIVYLLTGPQPVEALVAAGESLVLR